MESCTRTPSFTPFLIDNILNDCVRFRQFHAAADLAKPLDLCKTSPANREKRGGGGGIFGEVDEKASLLRKKKLRTTFTGRQIYELEKMFENKKYLNSKERTELSRYNSL